MPKPHRKRTTPKAVEANLIPVLSCMFLLIPALLLAMEIAPFKSISVRPPIHTSTGTPGKPTKPEVRVRVAIRQDGLRAELRRTDAPGPDVETFPLRAGSQDFDALERFASEVRRAFPATSSVELTAEGDTSLSTVVEAMDALRGRQCSLAEAEHSPDCLLWQVTVSG